MIQKDYIERLIQQVTKVMARLIGKDWEKALLVIEQVYHDWLPINRKEIIECLPEALLYWLVLEQKLSVDELEAIAELLQVEGEKLLEINQNQEAKDRLKKSLFLLEYVDAEHDIYSLERIHKVEQLRNILANSL